MSKSKWWHKCKCSIVMGSHFFKQEDVGACIISAQNYFNFWLCPFPIFKHWPPIHPWISVFHLDPHRTVPSSHSHQSTCPIQMTSSPYLRTFLTLIWKISPSQPYPQVEQSYDHSSLLDQPINMSSAPSCTPVVPQLIPTVPTVVSDYIASLLSFLLTHYFWTQTAF